MFGLAAREAGEAAVSRLQAQDDKPARRPSGVTAPRWPGLDARRPGRTRPRSLVLLDAEPRLGRRRCCRVSRGKAAAVRPVARPRESSGRPNWATMAATGTGSCALPPASVSGGSGRSGRARDEMDRAGGPLVDCDVGAKHSAAPRAHTVDLHVLLAHLGRVCRRPRAVLRRWRERIVGGDLKRRALVGC